MATLNRRHLSKILIPAIVYLILVLVMWLPFGPLNGLPYETAFPYMSETSTWWRGFLYEADPLRIHTNTFYQLSYLLGEGLGIGGSFLPYQIVYAVLWWARGFLVFLILDYLLPEYSLYNFVIGGLILVHASDAALEWVGQLNQFGFIFWMLLAFYLFLRAITAESRLVRYVLLICTAFFEYMSLWSYESTIFIFLLVPFILLVAYRKLWRRLLLMATVWYIVPLTYIFQTVTRYLNATGSSYQESVIRKDWSVFALMSDLWFNVVASLKFWDWGRGIQIQVSGPVQVGLTTSEWLMLSWFAAGVALVGGLVFWRIQHSNPSDVILPPSRVLIIIFFSGGILLAASFPAYLLLSSATSLWRTQFLSGIAAALVLGTVVALGARLVQRVALKVLLMLIFLAAVTFFGSSTAIARGADNYRIWEPHRQTIAQIIKVAPQIADGTLVILTDVPKNADPFRHNMWFDMALRLAYPQTLVTGVYFYQDGTPSPGNNMKLDGIIWRWDKTGYPPLIRETTVPHMLVIQYNAQGAAVLEQSLPPVFAVSNDVASLYAPTHLIVATVPPARVLNRYGR